MATQARVRPDRDRYFMGIAMAARARANCLGNRVGAVPPPLRTCDTQGGTS